MLIKRIAVLLFLVPLTLTTTLAQDKQVTLEEIWKEYKFWGSSVYGVRSMNDGVHFTTQGRDGSVDKYAYASYDKVGTIFSASDITGTTPEGADIVAEDYHFNADESMVLIETATEGIYRHSYKAYFYVLDLDSKELHPVADYTHGKIMLADFSPDGSKVAFVRDNNIFYTEIGSGEEVQVTTDGEYNSILNGFPDWVYEEEFGFNKGFKWSPDSKRIAFLRTDESNVKMFQMAMYGQLYPDQYTFKYPKAGEENAVTSMHVYDLESGATSRIDVGAETDQYVPFMQWTNDASVLCITRLNRLQNQLDLLTVACDGMTDGGTLKTKTLYTEKSDTYIDTHSDYYLEFLGNGKEFLWMSDMSGFVHIYIVNMASGEARQITNGEWDVADLYGIDERSGYIYFSSGEVSPMERHVYRIKTSGKGKTQLSTKQGQNSAKFSSGMKYYINYHSSANTPTYVTLHKADGKLIETLEDNEHLVSSLEEYDLSDKEFGTLTTSEGVELNYWMIKPSIFDPQVQYPLFFDIYCGPGSNTVNDAWDGDYMWHQMLAQEGYIVVSVDNRGTGFRGSEFKKCTYNELGKLETIDQIEAAKYFGSLEYIDADRIGVFGWSYGGFMASHLITQGADYFSMAIAVAPVTNWRYYDTIYTERYNGLPQDNPGGYDDNSPINHVDKLEGAYLLIHGSADDNVHYQNTMEMVEALVQADKQFDLFIYPDKNHGIYGGNTRYHLYNMMTEFIKENL